MKTLNIFLYKKKYFTQSSFKTIVLLFLMLVILENNIYAQSKQKPLSMEAMQLWRENSVTLSDNAKWYTIIYNLYNESVSKKDTTVEKEFAKYYKEDNQTDILYIYNTNEGLKYQVPQGSNPIFSAQSDWIAYQIKPKSEKDKSKKSKTIIALKHLASDFTIQYESSANYQFLEDKNYFITTDKNSLLIYDLANRREHYIGNIGEYLLDKKSKYIAYTISSKYKRGNGIYLYNPAEMTTKALQTGSFIYSNLSWNQNKNALVAYKYQKVEKKVIDSTKTLLVIRGIDKTVTSTEYALKDIKGIPENMTLAEGKANKIVWSNDDERLFIKLKKQLPKESKEKKTEDDKEAATVQIWHWKDKKLLSERMTAYERNQNQVFEAIFFRSSKTIKPLTGTEIQKLDYSKGTDQWAIGMDNRKYISDWDIKKHDLYSINLNTGAKKLIREKHSGSYYSANYEISPDGKKVVFWDEKDYWLYDFEKDSKRNITKNLAVSFINKDYDKYAYTPDYGFVGWVKNQNAVIVEHKLDLWLLPLDDNSKAQNLTASITSKDSIRFRVEDYRFAQESEIEDRYIDLSKPNILYAYNIKTKYAGFYKLQDGQLSKLIYEPVSFKSWRSYQLLKSKKSDVIIYKKGNYQNYPEAYLSTLDFKNPKKITNTNPQQEQFRWGKRILIDYTNKDGIPLQAILSIPNSYKKGQKLPMIVYSYEKYSWRMYRYATPYLSGASVPEMLYVSDGYLFLQPDIHFKVTKPHSSMHECIEAAIQKVIELGYVDEKRIGYEGFSFGGHCGMYISTQKNKFAAIAAGAGVSNLVQGFNIDIVWDGSNEQDYYMTGQGRLGTDPTSNTEMYISESPVFNAQTMNTPLLLFHGTADKVVQWEHSFGFYSILRYLKKPVVFLSYQGEGHGLRKESNRLDIQIRLKEFFDHYLKEGESKKWMLEEIPYVPAKEFSEEEKKKRMLPKWK